MQPLKNQKNTFKYLEVTVCFAESHTHTSYGINQILQNKTSSLSSRAFSWSRSIKKKFP